MEEESSGAKKGESDEKKKWQVGCSTAASQIDLLAFLIKVLSGVKKKWLEIEIFLLKKFSFNHKTFFTILKLLNFIY
jgi:hypothetical protein